MTDAAMPAGAAMPEKAAAAAVTAPAAAISAPLKTLEKKIVAAFADIESWLHAQHRRTPPPFYCSTDLRSNGNKLAPVDTNLFPGGFNNLSPNTYPLAAESIRHQMDLLCPNAKSLLLLPENHSRNALYLDNVAVLKQLIEMAGIQVRLGRLDGSRVQLTSAAGALLDMQPVERDGARLKCGDFSPCAVLLNNDLAGGLPPLLQGVEIPILPPPHLGWARRKKSAHFFHYNRVAEEFAALLGADAWLLCADFHVCPSVDFHKREGMECLAAAIDETLAQIKEKYRQHDIADEPYVVLKANAGTYGMGVMMVKDAAAVFNLNRKQRNRMATGKDGMKTDDILIQEGISTVDFFNGAAAEPVLYMLGGATVGGFYRINSGRDRSDNLNSRGMSFSPLPFETCCAPPMHCAPTAVAPAAAVVGGGDVGAGGGENSAANTAANTAARLYVYSVIARLAGLAAAREAAALENEQADITAADDTAAAPAAADSAAQ